MIRPRPTSTLFPYTTLFRSVAAERRLRAINSGIAVEGIVADLSPKNAPELLRGFPVILDGTDNFETRFLLNDAAMRSEEHTSELQSRSDLVCRLLLEKKNRK